MRFQKALLPAILAGGFAAEAAALNIPLHKKQSDVNRADAIKEAFTHSWEGYVKYAYGKDELRPVSNTGSNSRYLNIDILRVERVFPYQRVSAEMVGGLRWLTL